MLGPCKAVGVQAKVYGKTTAGDSRQRRHSTGPGWRKRTGSLGNKKRAAPRCALHDTNHSFIDLFSNIAVNRNAQLVINLSFILCVRSVARGVLGCP